MKVKPLKKFGQNYLIDKNIINKIVEEIAPAESDTIIEIGPGTGALTYPLSRKVNTLHAVELDSRVIEELSRNIPNLRMINADFLKSDISDLTSGASEIRIVGNIPYNITSPILFRIIENRHIVKDAVLMMQYEVARRLVAKKDTKEYGILSVILNAIAEVKLCFKISPNVFHPRPNVDSAIVHLKLNKDISGIPDLKLFIRVVKGAFGNRRKTLKNSFGNSIFADADFSKFPVDTTRRAENLSIKEFVAITEFLYRCGYRADDNQHFQE
ncbi:MAG: 16S rRNA (adenine(1518)-N(6)/adenine(1519)-N(6))-dimethyltransferase RsmA [Ignavibacteriaceae bacterium]|nr:16S rRNA (adenine(1518)-N(6)/adenine(1519)-N(6))-dimethyltransferase RsmA [Ignavibacteriaceae bacterium]